MQQRDSGLKLDANTEKQVKKLIEDGKLVQAVALVRQGTGSGLAEAKNLVESLRDRPFDSRRDKSKHVSVGPLRPLHPDARKEVEEHLRKGDETKAVALIRAETGLSLLESREVGRQILAALD
jgi:hypothetical protein